MKVLMLGSDQRCSHDYGADHLFAGFTALVGYDNVWDWPAKPTLHRTRDDECDCNIDSDQRWPAREAPPIEELATTADVVLVTAHCRDREGLERAARVCQTLVPARTPIAAIDYSDDVTDLGALYAAVIGRTFPYFKREFPVEANWQAAPLPLSYPAQRTPLISRQRHAGVLYWGAAHRGHPEAPGEVRAQIIADLKVRVHWTQRDLRLTPSQARGTRPSPEQYHDRMMRATIGWVWNGAKCWDTNRFWEQFCFGLAQVAERPRIKLPHAPVDGEHCIYVDRPNQIAVVVKQLLDNQDFTERLAAAGHQWWRQYHTSTARAGYVLAMIGGADEPDRVDTGRVASEGAHDVARQD